MKRSFTAAAILTAAIFGSGAWLAVRTHGASAAPAPAKASCCADKAGAQKHACGADDGCCGKAGCGGKDDCRSDCKGMNPEMAAKVAEMDKRLDGLVATMNSAKGEEKVDAMAAVITEMLARRAAMHAMRHDHHGAQPCGAAATDAGKTEEKSEGLPGEPEHSH